MSRLSVCQSFIVAGSIVAITCAGLRDTWEGDGIQVGLAQPLASMPLSVASVLKPRWREGAGQADGGRQGGGAVGSPLLAVPPVLPTSDGSVRAAWV